MREGRFRVRARSTTVVRRAVRPALPLLGASLVMWACSSTVDETGRSARSAPSQASSLTSSWSGVCASIAALPDDAAVRRAFLNLAHEPLHALAADARLDRLTAGRVLEAMQRVEADFDGSPDGSALADDLTELEAAADAGLSAVGVAPPPCTP